MKNKKSDFLNTNLINATSPHSLMPQQDIIAKIREFTGHDYIRLLPSGNAAIFAAMHIAKKVNNKAFFLIPDQGGWLTYRDYPKLLNIDIQEIKTDQGILNLEDLKKHAASGTALIYSNPAGYFAEQPAKQIYDLCKKNKCPVIMDISGSFGTKMCNGDCADILVCSFGKWKIVDNGYGGFISSNNRSWFEEARLFYKMMKVHPRANQEIIKKIENIKSRLDLFTEKRKKVLADLKNMDIVHPDKQGINVVIRFKNQKEKDKILKYCRDNNLEYTECPRYIRINEPAVSIEIKRLG